MLIRSHMLANADIRKGYVRHTSCTFWLRWYTSVYILLYAETKKKFLDMFKIYQCMRAYRIYVTHTLAIRMGYAGHRLDIRLIRWRYVTHTLCSYLPMELTVSTSSFLEPQIPELLNLVYTIIGPFLKIVKLVHIGPGPKLSKWCLFGQKKSSPKGHKLHWITWKSTKLMIPSLLILPNFWHLIKHIYIRLGGKAFRNLRWVTQGPLV